MGVHPGPDPQWDYYNESHDTDAQFYGAEYQLGEFGVPNTNTAQFVGGNTVFQEDVSCSVFRATRPTTIMIPGITECYSGRGGSRVSGYGVQICNVGFDLIDLPNFS